MGTGTVVGGKIWVVSTCGPLSLEELEFRASISIIHFHFNASTCRCLEVLDEKDDVIGRVGSLRKVSIEYLDSNSAANPHNSFLSTALSATTQVYMMATKIVSRQKLLYNRWLSQ